MSLHFYYSNRIAWPCICLFSCFCLAYWFSFQFYFFSHFLFFIHFLSRFVNKTMHENFSCMAQHNNVEKFLKINCDHKKLLANFSSSSLFGPTYILRPMMPEWKIWSIWTKIRKRNHDACTYCRIFIPWLSMVMEWCFSFWSNRVQKGKEKTKRENINFKGI